MLIMLKIVKVSEGFYKATNVVSEQECYICQDMLGDFRGSWEIKKEDGTFDADESDAYQSIEEAARWIECQGVVMSTNFDGSPMIQEAV